MKKISLLFLCLGLVVSCTKQPVVKLSSERAKSMPHYSCSERIVGEWELVRVLDSDSLNISYYADTVVYTGDTSQWWNNDSIAYFKIMSNQSEYPLGIYNFDCKNEVLTIGQFSCGISFTKYKVNQLNNNTFEYEYDSFLNIGSHFYGGSGGHNYLYSKL